MEGENSITNLIHLGVVGKNISYSQSPRIHTCFAEAEGISLSYTIEEVGSGSFTEKIKALRTAGFLGCNITVPFKEEAFALAHHKTDHAIQAGAANTFLFKAGKIFADNTDGIGLIRDLTQHLNIPLRNKRILICGAGGAVRGILGPLLAQHPETILIANRSLDKAQDLVTNFAAPRLQALEYTDLATQRFDLLIDGTSLKTAALPLPDSLQWSQEACVYDLKYGGTSLSPTLAWAKTKNLRAYDGIGMLIEQAAAAFTVWTGHTPDTKELREILQ